MCIKVGDRVRRVVVVSGPRGAKGYEFIVARTDGVIAFEPDHTPHSVSSLEKVDDLQTRISKLECELKKLKEEATNQSLDEAKLLRHKNSGNLWNIVGRDGDHFWVKKQITDNNNVPLTFHRRDMDRFEVVSNGCD